MDFGTVDLFIVNGNGPEDVLVDGEGTVYTGLEDGRVVRLDDLGARGARIEVIAETGGRPLGIEFFGEELLVCDGERGLLVVSPAEGTVSTLADSIAGVPMLVCNNAAVAADGTVYFSDSSARFPLSKWRDDLVEQTATGRLLRRNPDGTVDQLVGGLQFANGVALARDESFVVVAETGACRLRRVWLTGERAGTTDVFLDGLRGHPDNLSTGSDGLIWVAEASPRVGALELMRKLPSPLRTGIRALPGWIQPKPGPSCGVLGVSADSEIVHDLSGVITGFRMPTGIRESAGRLYLGSLAGQAIARTSVPSQ
ncbi:strictosidine synthase [Prauserella marina]|uniref:Sugar lactone lactonase YvrE n=1 Tax=Prauserella marina TaxID=530584 RepID=A0A222VN28_9PSEU|nr:SMP-30/gluconolactonase/LRE family protein [Prauserella marina]ASR35163.1 strictosidine synthase [Prauserella marina]PWV85074.1 sugar lactone lactonase YvrE [Prauserella marina]SDC05388.1 Sugar lactone lactonase YvrE [Prauserella marina]